MHTKVLILIILTGIISCGAVFVGDLADPVPADQTAYIEISSGFNAITDEFDDGYWTVSCWFNGTTTNQATLWGVRSAGNGEIFLKLNTSSGGVKNTGYIQFVVVDADGQTLRAGHNANAGYGDGNWHNVVVQFSCPADTVRFYLDGVRKATTYGAQQDCDNMKEFNDNMGLGMKNDNGTGIHGFTNGYIAEYAFFKEELSLQKIESLAARKRCAMQVGQPYAYWKLNEFTEGQVLNTVQIKDFSGNNYYGTGVTTALLGYSDPITY